MSSKTSIQWCDVVDNIIVVEGGGWWCRKISPGCAHCYAENLNQNRRYSGNGLPYFGKAPTLILRRDLLEGWRHQQKPKRHFVASMTDIFGEWVSPVWTYEFLDAMRAAPTQTFQLLTKRPAIALDFTENWLEERKLAILPRNIWMGASAEDQECLKERMYFLGKIRAVVRFLSLEPLLGPIDLTGCLKGDSRVHWVIVGGESGPQSRPCDAYWVDAIRKQCAEDSVAFFMKQFGNNPVHVGPFKYPKGGVAEEWPAKYRVRNFPQMASWSKRLSQQLDLV